MSEWIPTGKIRYRKASWFGRRKLVLQLQEYRLQTKPFDIREWAIERWRDITPDDASVLAGLPEAP